MRALRSAAVSSALLFMLGSWCPHPASWQPGLPSVCMDEPVPPLVIVEFYPCAVAGDEYLVLCNRADEAVNLLDWTVSDGEGTITFADRFINRGESLSISENASSYSSAYGEPPGMSLPGWTSGESASVSGSFRLADAGDSLVVSSPSGAVSDSVAYGDAATPSVGWSGDPVPSLRRGEVARRVSREAVVDTDSSGDWMPFRESKYGYTSHGAASAIVPAGRVVSFVSPDCSLDAVLDAIGRARSDIRACAYEISSSPVCTSLCDARSRGVSVRVMVDALPVGGMSTRQVACLSRMANDGVDVRVIGGDMDDGVVRHVGAMHSKYIAVDGEVLVVISENLVEDGVPVDRLFGNRGWGVTVASPELATYMASVFDEDSRLDRADVWQWLEDPRCDTGADMPEAVQDIHPTGVLKASVSRCESEVSVFVSPDVSEEAPFIVPLISGSSRVSFEQFQAELMWDTRWSGSSCISPVLEAVDAVLCRGGTARGLFDSTWFNVEDNSEAVSFLSASACAAATGSSFGLLAEESPVTVLHNKGMVLDETVLISSNNWVFGSFASNRELAVTVHSPESSSYFQAAFELDWVPDTTPPVAGAGPDVFLPALGPAYLDASASWDDRAVAWMSWDFDGDGEADAEGTRATFEPTSVGTHVVRLEVEDAWGNTAVDWVTVTVGHGMVPEDAEQPLSLAVPWPLPAIVSALVVGALAARKLNLLRLSTRRKG